MTSADLHRSSRIGLSLYMAAFAEIVNKLSPLIVLAVAKSRLGLSGFGQAQSSLTAMEALIPLVTLGYPSWASIELGRNQGTSRNAELTAFIIGDTLILKGIQLLIVCIAAASFGYFSIGIFSTGHINTSVTLAAGLLLVASFVDTDFVHFGHQSLSLRYFLTIISKIAALLGVLFFVVGPSDVAAYAGFAAAPSLFLSFSSAFFNHGLLKQFRFSSERLKKAFISSIKLGFIAVLVTQVDRFDVLMVQQLFGDEKTGLYAGQMRLVQAVNSAWSIIGLVFYSEMLKENDPTNFANLAQKSLWGILALTAPIAAGVWFVRDDVLTLMYGPEYLATSLVFFILVLGSIGSGFIQVFGSQIAVIKQKHVAFIATLIVTLALGMATSFWLAKSFGIIGVAVGSFVTKLFAGGILIFCTRKYVTAEILWRVWPIIASTIIMTVALTYMPQQNLVITIAMGAVIYALGLASLDFKTMALIFRKMRGRS
jgi:O-antigen/teichoic acid export membrane protein